MKKTSRLTITLPTDLVEAMDRKLAGGDESRSALIRRLLEDVLHEIERQDDVERYVRSYREHPQTEAEFG